MILYIGNIAGSTLIRNDLWRLSTPKGCTCWTRMVTSTWTVSLAYPMVRIDIWRWWWWDVNSWWCLDCSWPLSSNRGGGCSDRHGPELQPGLAHARAHGDGRLAQWLGQLHQSHPEHYAPEDQQGSVLQLWVRRLDYRLGSWTHWIIHFQVRG